MKKFLNITALVLCVAVVIGMGISSLADASVNQASPNQARVKIMGPHAFRGFLQIQPSYNQNGQHAQYGEVWLSSPTNGSQSPVQTEVGTHEGDTRLLDAYTPVMFVKAYPNTTDTGDLVYPDPILNYRIKWQPHTGDPTRPWAHPFSISPIENLIEPQLGK